MAQALLRVKRNAAAALGCKLLRTIGQAPEQYTVSYKKIATWSVVKNMTNAENYLRACLLVALMLVAPNVTAQVSLIILDFELVSEMHDPRTAEAEQVRLALVSQELNSHLEACPAFKVLGAESAQSTIALSQSRVAYLHRCNGCAKAIGTAADAQLVLFPWVQKVSNLILNLNVEIRSAATDRVVAARSVDIRGNTDRSWLRGAKALAERLCELDGDRLSQQPLR